MIRIRCANKWVQLVFSMVLLGVSAELAAATMYVTDRFEVSLRSGESTKHKIIRLLPSGTPLTVIEQNEESGYTHVRLNNGTDGWMLTRFLSNQPSARAVLARGDQELSTIKEENKLLKEELDRLKSSHQQALQENGTLSTAKEKMDQELQAIRHASANAIQLKEERDRLENQVASLSRELETIKHDKQMLEAGSQHEELVYGAGILAIGLIIGWVITLLFRRRKRASWNNTFY